MSLIRTTSSSFDATPWWMIAIDRRRKKYAYKIQFNVPDKDNYFFTTAPRMMTISIVQHLLNHKEGREKMKETDQSKRTIY